MREGITDPEALGYVRPLDLVAYLRATGWTTVEEWKSGTVWAKEGSGSPVTALVPAEQTFSDYSVRVMQALESIAEVEGRLESEIVDDLNAATSDTVRIAVKGDAGVGGNVSLPYAARIIGNARDMIIAAACSVIEPRAAYGTKKPSRALDYVTEYVQFGQTRRGSFVATILCRVPPLLTSAEVGDWFPEHLEEPFERRVTKRLFEAIGAVKGAVTTAMVSGDIAVFRDAVPRGVSANLCQAVVGLMPEDRSSSVQLGFGWAAVRPDSGLARGEFTFSSDEGEVVGEAARLLAETEPRDDFELFGLVVRLDKPEGSDTGTATLSTVVDGQARAVKVRLPAPLYDVAIDSHRHDRVVRMVGILVKEGRSYELQSVAAVGVLDC